MSHRPLILIAYALMVARMLVCDRTPAARATWLVASVTYVIVAPYFILTA